MVAVWVRVVGCVATHTGPTLLWTWLSQRLKPFEERMPDATFQQRARAAYFERVNLSAQGFYATPNVR